MVRLAENQYGRHVARIRRRGGGGGVRRGNSPRPVDVGHDEAGGRQPYTQYNTAQLDGDFQIAADPLDARDVRSRAGDAGGHGLQRSPLRYDDEGVERQRSSLLGPPSTGGR